jgi:hypothetical protein
MHSRRWIALVTVASFLVAALVEGGADAIAIPIAVGDRVRVSSGRRPDAHVIGEVEEVDQRGLVVKLDGHGDRRRLQWQSVSDLWISLGKRSDPKGGAVTGALAVGIPLGLAGALFVPCWDEGMGTGGACRTTHAVAGLAAGAFAGGLVGAALGSIKIERWKRVAHPPPQLSIDVAPRRSGLGAEVTLQF